jgi:hypothetical protein
MYNLEEIRKKMSLAALAEEAGAQFDNPYRLMSRCPLPRHAGDRSSRAFTIFDQGKRWKCFSACPSDAKGGDIFGFYMAWKGVDFKTAVTELSERIGLQPSAASSPKVERTEIPTAPTAPDPAWRARAEQFIVWAESNLASHPGAQAYLEKERGLSPETWRAFRLGFNPTNLYDDPARWGLDGKKIWLPRGIVIPGFWQGEPWYVKIRRPLPGQALGDHIGNWNQGDSLADVKFGGPRGGISTLFRLELQDFKPALILTEGEWDTMLTWEYCPDLCDVATLGGAGARFDVLDLTLLTRYPLILVIHDDDAAGEKGREYIATLQQHCPRIMIVHPPAHDLSDYWKGGDNLRTWLVRSLASTLKSTLTANAPEDWRRVAWLAEQES